MALIVALLAGAGWAFFLRPYQKDRIGTFLNPDRDPLGKGYQVTQAKIAIGSGGIHGKGFKQGTQAKLEFLPARHTDFIFAVLGEEWGFIGVAIVLALYLFLIVQALQFAKNARDRGGAYSEDKHKGEDNRQQNSDKTGGRDDAQGKRGGRETDRGDRDKNDYPSSSRPTQYPNSPDYQNNSGVN